MHKVLRELYDYKLKKNSTILLLQLEQSIDRIYTLRKIFPFFAKSKLGVCTVVTHYTHIFFIMAHFKRMIKLLF